MKVYISGPITGTEDYMERFAAAEEELKGKGYEVYNPAKVNQNMPQTASREDYMRVAIAMLTCCDIIYMLRGWEQSCRDTIEYHVAMAAGMVIWKQEAPAKPKAYEKEQEIKVNDIVKLEDEEGEAIVTAICSGFAYIMWKDGSCGNYGLSELEKTGRTAEGLDLLLKQLQE